MITLLLDLSTGPMPWFCVCRKFETPEEAYASFVDVNEYDHSGKRHIGVFRHFRVGLDEGAVLVSAVGDKREGVETAERILWRGEEIELHPDTWLALIKRRVEVIIALSKAGAGRARTGSSPTSRL